MTYILIQIRRHQKAGFELSSNWHKATPINLRYEDQTYENPFLYLHMQLGHKIQKESNSIFFDKKFKKYKANASKKQILIATRGINTENFPFLKQHEADALHNLAFADQVFAKYLETNQEDVLIKKEYESVVEFEHKQEINQELNKYKQKIDNEIKAAKFTNSK